MCTKNIRIHIFILSLLLFTIIHAAARSVKELRSHITNSDIDIEMFMGSIQPDEIQNLKQAIHKTFFFTLKSILEYETFNFEKHASQKEESKVNHHLNKSFSIMEKYVEQLQIMIAGCLCLTNHAIGTHYISRELFLIYQVLMKNIKENYSCNQKRTIHTNVLFSFYEFTGNCSYEPFVRALLKMDDTIIYYLLNMNRLCKKESRMYFRTQKILELVYLTQPKTSVHFTLEKIVSILNYLGETFAVIQTIQRTKHKGLRKILLSLFFVVDKTAFVKENSSEILHTITYSYVANGSTYKLRLKKTPSHYDSSASLPTIPQALLTPIHKVTTAKGRPIPSKEVQTPSGGPACIIC